MEGLWRDVKFLENIQITDCFIHLNDAWNSLKNSTLNKVWKQLLGESCVVNQDALVIDRPSMNVEETVSNAICNVVDNETDYDPDVYRFPEDTSTQLSQILARIDLPVNQVKANLSQWFHSDDSDCGWEQLTDNQIVNFVSYGQIKAGSAESLKENKTDFENSQSQKISAEKALQGLKLFKNWLSQDADNRFSPHHRKCLKEIVHLTENKINKSSENKVYFNL